MNRSKKKCRRLSQNNLPNAKLQWPNAKQTKEKGVKPTAEERFARENKMLDEQIAMQDKMKKS
jgi:hypothetical protein